MVLTRIRSLIQDWLVALKAATSIDPTISVLFIIFHKFEKDANLLHHFVCETDVRTFDIDSIGTANISFFLTLVPHFESKTMSGIVILPVGASRCVELAHIEPFDIHVLVELTSLLDRNPTKTNAHFG